MLLTEKKREIVGNHPFNVILERFSGPLDLLLHLVYQHELAIEKVDLRLVTEQYLAVIENANYLDLEVAGDYLVITATLISYKLKSLIPSGESDKLNVEEESAFLEELREKLRRYEIARSGAENLQKLNQLGSEIFVRKLKEDFSEDLVSDSSSRLATLFAGLIKRVGGLNSEYSILSDQIPLIHFMRQTLSWLKSPIIPLQKKVCNSWFSFLKQASQSSNIATREVVIGSFIAILELAKRGIIKVESGSAGDINLNQICFNETTDENTIDSTNTENSVNGKKLAIQEHKLELEVLKEYEAKDTIIELGNEYSSLFAG